MPTGNDARQGARQTFAFNSAAPVQNQSAARGNSRGVQISGGNAQGGIVTSGQQTDAGPVGAQLGQYFQTLMEPYVQRKQNERFFEGFTEAANGTAIKELVDGDNPINSIFGPTGFEQGAQTFAANTALDTYSADVTTNIGEWAKMTPQEAAKALSTKSAAMMTGDTGTDQLIQAGLMERMGPVMNTVAKARQAWQQTTAKNAYTESRNAADTAFQTLMFAQLSMEPTAEGTASMTAAKQNFLVGAAKPEGMTDETYANALAASAKSGIVAGNLHAVTTMRAAGAWKFLDEETQNKLEAAYISGSAKALGKSATMIVPDLVRLRAAIKRENIPGGGMGAATQLMHLNNKLKAAVGTTEDLFDYKDYTGEAMSVIDILVAAKRRQEVRAEQLTDMRTRRGWEIEDRNAAAAADAAEDAAESAQTVALWGIGDITGALAANSALGKDFNAIALAEVRSGNTTGIMRAWQTSKWVSPSTATQLQSVITSSIGDEYSPDIGKAHDQWAAINKQSPSLAAAYYGNMQAPMLRFDMLLKTTGPQAAFRQAFGNPGIYHPAAIPADRKAAVSAMIPEAIEAKESSWWNYGGQARLNGSSMRAATAALTEQVAMYAAANPTLTDAQVVAMATAAKTGTSERYGAFFFTKAKDHPSLSSLTGLQGKEMDDTFTSVIDYRLKKAGFKDGASGDNIDITPMRLPNNAPAYHVMAHLEDGSGTKDIILSAADFKAFHQHKVDRKFLHNPANRGNPAHTATLARFKAYKEAYPE